MVELAFRFMNSYLRATLNARAVRTAYNVLNQYRLLVEAMIRGHADDLALEGVRHMIYYGRTSYDMQLGFVTETVAYDVSALCEFAHAHDARRTTSTTRCSTMFLELDQPLRAQAPGVGPAGHPQGADEARLLLPRRRRRASARRRSPTTWRARIASACRSIREQLERVESKDFWEIIDRGRNFEYMPPRQKEQMEKFFALLPPKPRPTPTPT